MKILIFGISLLAILSINAQKDTINPIEEVSIFSRFSSENQLGYSLIIITDSVLKSENKSLKYILKKHTNTYIKEQGHGMLASLAMRGTAASHTAVYWNGIPINSSLNGQTDFNSIFPAAYNRVSIKKGGGSVLLGSGAIGGSINLENKLNFKSKTKGRVQVSGGSYETFSSFFNLEHSSNQNFALQFSHGVHHSKNNYPYLDTEKVNTNGETLNYTTQLSLGYKWNPKNKIYVKAWYNNSDRNTSGTLYTESNANLLFKNQTLLIGWKNKTKLLKTELKSAFVDEVYKYTFNPSYPDFYSDNKSNNWITSLEANYPIRKKINIFSGLSYEILRGHGTDILKTIQQKIAVFASVRHTVTPNFKYNLSARKGGTDTYKIPMVFAFDSKIDISKSWVARINLSTNFRTPSLNDLYWQPGGNPKLKSEKSKTGELSLSYKISDILVTGLNGFLIDSNNLIQWQPTIDGIWQPLNIQNVSIYGLEYNFMLNIKINQHIFSTNLNYSYTVSRDREKEKQLIYVPFHTGALNFQYNYKNWEVSYETLYTGSVYTTSSNSKTLDAYFLSNINLKRSVWQKKMDLYLSIDNIANKNYQVVQSRPMPGRNYLFNINFNF